MRSAPLSQRVHLHASQPLPVPSLEKTLEGQSSPSRNNAAWDGHPPGLHPGALQRKANTPPSIQRSKKKGGGQVRGLTCLPWLPASKRTLSLPTVPGTLPGLPAHPDSAKPFRPPSSSARRNRAAHAQRLLPLAGCEPAQLVESRPAFGGRRLWVARAGCLPHPAARLLGRPERSLWGAPDGNPAKGLPRPAARSQSSPHSATSFALFAFIPSRQRARRGSASLVGRGTDRRGWSCPRPRDARSPRRRRPAPY